jgi:hypothetical protein
MGARPTQSLGDCSRRVAVPCERRVLAGRVEVVVFIPFPRRDEVGDDGEGEFIDGHLDDLFGRQTDH